MARLAWPLAAKFDLRYHMADNLARLATLEGRHEPEATLLGYADAGYSAHGLARRSTERGASERAGALAGTWEMTGAPSCG